MTIVEAMRVLCVNKQDTLEEIKVKYRAMAKKYHPDVYAGNNSKEKMQEINMAYDYIKKHYNEMSSTGTCENTNKVNNNDSSNNTYNKQTDYREIYDKYTRIFGINTGYESFMIMYKELSKYGNLSDFATFLVSDFASMVFYAKQLRKDVYDLYCFMKKMKVDITSTDKFVEILRKLVLKQDELCKKIGKSSDTLYNEFLIDDTKESGHNFIAWLKNEIVIKEYCQLLNKTKKELYYQYLCALKFVSDELTFLEWLSSRKNVQKVCSLLKVSEYKLLTLWQAERNQGVTYDNFVDWITNKLVELLYMDIDINNNIDLTSRKNRIKYREYNENNTKKIC